MSKKKLRKLLKLAELTDRLSLPTVGPETIRVPTDVVPAVVTAWEAKEADAIASLFLQDADLVNSVGLWWTGRNSVRKALEYMFERIYESPKVTVEQVSERRLADGAALVLVRWRMSGQVDPEGRPTEPRRGVLSATLVRLEDGFWMIAAAHNTDMVVAADTWLVRDGVLMPASYIGGPTPEELAVAELVADSGE